MDNLTCYRRQCIYWQDNACLLAYIDIDEQCLCTCCIDVQLSEEELAPRRQALRDFYEQEEG